MAETRPLLMAPSQQMQPTILVTGGCGLLGSRLVRLLAGKLPAGRIIVTARGELQGSMQNGPVTIVHGDLRDGSFWAGLPATITHVFHLAAVIPRRAEDGRKASIVADNLTPLAHLIEHSVRWPGLRQIIYASSVSVYAPTSDVLQEDSLKRPVGLYGACKLAGEELLSCLEEKEVRNVSLRFSSLYAHGQYQGTVLPLMVGRARRRQNIVIFGDGTRTQDFLHFEDAARAFWYCFQKEARGVFNIGTGTPVTMTELAQTVSRVFADGTATIEYQPATGQDPGIKLDVTKARDDLGYQADLSLESGLFKIRQEMGDIGE